MMAYNSPLPVSERDARALIAQGLIERFREFVGQSGVGATHLKLDAVDVHCLLAYIDSMKD